MFLKGCTFGVTFICPLVLVLPEELWIQKYTLAQCHVTWCKHVNFTVGLMCLEREVNAIQSRWIAVNLKSTKYGILLSWELVVCFFINEDFMPSSVVFVLAINIKRWCKLNDYSCDTEMQFMSRYFQKVLLLFIFQAYYMLLDCYFDSNLHVVETINNCYL